MKGCAVVVPAYKAQISRLEALSLSRTSKILSQHDLFLLQPDGADLTATYDAEAMRYQSLCFPTRYFEDIAGYNRLMLSESFYGRFQDYKYLLIVQLDALILSDRLTHFCALEYDYFGAPWVGYEISEITTLAPYLPVRFRSRILNRIFRLFDSRWAVGNGGFSLRKVASSMEVLRRNSSQGLYDFSKFSANEDNFWSFVAPRILPTFRVAPFRSALDFAFEMSPKTCFRLNGHKMPFGCHAYEKHDPEFWEEKLAQLGENELAQEIRIARQNEMPCLQK